jgi:hypothetical protein
VREEEGRERCEVVSLFFMRCTVPARASVTASVTLPMAKLILSEK